MKLEAGFDELVPGEKNTVCRPPSQPLISLPIPVEGTEGMSNFAQSHLVRRDRRQPTQNEPPGNKEIKGVDRMDLDNRPHPANDIFFVGWTIMVLLVVGKNRTSCETGCSPKKKGMTQITPGENGSRNSGVKMYPPPFTTCSTARTVMDLCNPWLAMAMMTPWGQAGPGLRQDPLNFRRTEKRIESV